MTIADVDALLEAKKEIAVKDTLTPEDRRRLDAINARLAPVDFLLLHRLGVMVARARGLDPDLGRAALDPDDIVPV